MARAENVKFEEFRTRFSTEELEQLFCTLIAKDRAIFGHIYGVFGYEKLSAGELGCILRHTAAVGAVVQRPLCGLSSGRN